VPIVHIVYELRKIKILRWLDLSNIGMRDSNGRKSAVGWGILQIPLNCEKSDSYNQLKVWENSPRVYQDGALRNICGVDIN